MLVMMSLFVEYMEDIHTFGTKHQHHLYQGLEYFTVGLSWLLCVCCPVWASIAKWSRYQPSNWKAVNVIPGVATLLFPCMSKKLDLHVSSLPSCVNGDPVPTGEVAQPAAWWGRNAQPSLSLVSAIFYHETWTVLLWVSCPMRICLHRGKKPEWCTDIPVVVAITMLHMAAISFAFVL